MQNLSFGFKRKHCIFVADFSEHFGNLAVFSAFNRNYSLTRCWEKFIGIKRSYRVILTVAKVKSFKSCLCKHKSIVLTVQQLFKSGVNIAPYILEFCIRIDFLRKKRTVSDDGEEIWDESAIDSFYRGEDAKTVRECMDRLNNDYRTVLYLVYFEEVDGDGAAKIMSKSKKQLANLLYRAKQALKTELEKEGFCYEDR